MKKLVIALMAVVVVVAGAAAARSTDDKIAENSAAGSAGPHAQAARQPEDTKPTEGIVTPIAKDGVKTVIITANDTDASPDTINVNRGDKVVITFKVAGQGSSRGDLIFRSLEPPVESDPIDPGKSGDVTFTATKSFDFTPYWRQSDKQGEYKVSVKVL